MDAVKSNRLIVSSTVLACGMLDASRFKSRAELDHTLLRAAEQAFSLRDLLAVRRAAEALLYSTDMRAQSAGRYYLAWIDKREGRSHIARRALSNLIGDSSAAPSYRARAYRTLALIEQESGNADAAMRMYNEAATLSAKESDYLNLGLSLIATATLTTDYGDYANGSD